MTDREKLCELICDGTNHGNYMKPADKWLCMGIPCNVAHWMPLPEAPMEE